MQKAARWLFPVFPLLCMILGALPESIVMHFGAPPEIGGSHVFYCNYYDMMVLGYGNMGPILTMGLCLILIILCIINAKTDNRVSCSYASLVEAVAFLASLMNLLFREMTAIGYVISALLLIMTVLQVGYNNICHS